MANEYAKNADWWDDLSDEDKKEYVERHPRSKYAKNYHKNKTEPVVESTNEGVKQSEIVESDKTEDGSDKPTPKAYKPKDVAKKFSAIPKKDRRTIGKLLSKYVSAESAKEKAGALGKAAAIMALKAGVVGAAFMLGGGPLLLSFPLLLNNILDSVEGFGNDALANFNKAHKAIKQTFEDEELLQEKVDALNGDDVDNDEEVLNG